MNITQGSGTEKKDYRTDIILIGILFAWTFFVNRKIRMSGYYMDDLYMWSCWGEQSFLEYVFPLGSTRCRFVYWLAAWAELLLIRNHIEWVVPLNLMLNGALAAFLYGFAAKLSRSRIVGFAAGILFVVSRFAYYQTGQLLGLMETMGTAFALAMAYCLYQYMHEEKRQNLFFGLALLFYFLNCFTHERYMVLLPMFYYVLLIRKDRKWYRWVSPAVLFGLVLLIRRLMIGTLSPAGTGGTNVAETLTKSGVVKNLLAEIAYLVGINAGPEHLNGLPWAASPFGVKLVILFTNLLLFLLSCMVVLDLIQRRRYGLPMAGVFADAVFFLGFLTGCMVSSAVTIRVEMRWIYVAYAFKLLLVSSLFGARREVRLMRDADPEAEDRFRISDHFPVAVIILIAILTVPVQLYYRNAWPKIYLFPNQARYNSLADVTYGKYGKDVLGKEIVIIGNSYEMSDFTAETFFKTFDPERTGQGTTVRHVESILDFGQVTPNMLILKEDPAHDCFTDATDLVRSLKLGVDYGYYRDGWMDERAKIRILTGPSGVISFETMYPGNLTGKEQIKVKTGKEILVFPVLNNVDHFKVEAEPRQIVELEFETNFHVEPAAEQRGTDRLAIIANFTTE